MEIKLDIYINDIHHLIPNIYLSLYGGPYLKISILCFNITLWIILKTIKFPNNYFNTPSITLEEFTKESPYKYKFEIYAFGYVYRKSFCRNKEIIDFIDGLYNTPEFVKSGWFNQFIESDYNIENFNEFMQDMNNLIDKYKERYNKKS